MANTLRIGLIGDRSDDVRAHEAIPTAFALLEQEGGPAAELEWLPTDGLTPANVARLAHFDGLWCVPGSPYLSFEGALRAIRFARERRRPFLGTCGGFQHALIEVARNELGVREADHAESNPSAPVPLIHRLACSLVGVRGRVLFAAGSRIADAYDGSEAVEGYHCNYGVNPTYAGLVEASPLRVTAIDDAGDIRAVEIKNPGHFFVATLFQPELASFKGITPPLVRAFAKAALDLARAASDDDELPPSTLDEVAPVR